VLFRSAGNQRRILEQELALVGMLHQRTHSAAVRGLGAVVAGGHQEEEAHHDLVLLQPLTVDLRVHQHAREIVGGVLAALGDHPPAPLEDVRDVVLGDALDTAGLEVGNPSVSAVTPPSSEEYVLKSRLTAWMSSGRVTDQKPASFGYSVTFEVQWIGHSWRSSRNSSCGGPSSHSSRSVTRTSSRFVLI